MKIRHRFPFIATLTDFNIIIYYKFCIVMEITEERRDEKHRCIASQQRYRKVKCLGAFISLFSRSSAVAHAHTRIFVCLLHFAFCSSGINADKKPLLQRSWLEACWIQHIPSSGSLSNLFAIFSLIFWHQVIKEILFWFIFFISFIPNINWKGPYGYLSYSKL